MWRAEVSARFDRRQVHAGAHRAFQGGAEVEIARLVVGRVGVGDVGRQHFLALRAQIQRLLEKAWILAEAVYHPGRVP